VLYRLHTRKIARDERYRTKGWTSWSLAA
jgi:hypothetical protein